MKTARNLLFANNIWRMVIVFTLFAICYFIFAISTTHAYDVVSGEKNSTTYTSDNESLKDSNNSLNTSPDVPKNFHSLVQIVMIETLSAAVCQLAGVDPISSSHKCLGVNPKTGEIGLVENGGGLITVMGKLIDTTLTPPVSSMQYISYLKGNFGVVKPIYAQESECATDTQRGVGFCSLLPVLDLWVAMRNIVYLILILVFVVIGLGIMLRIHIDPRTVMTIQNQIPKIIIGIVVITFSFAIAGFLIDVMWVAVYLFATVIRSATDTDPTIMRNMVQAGNPIDAANNLPGGMLNIASQTAQAFSEIVTSVFNDDSNILVSILGGAVTILATLILLIAIIVALIRLWVMLVITFLNVILDVVFAPFWIIAGILPGSTMGIGGWFRDLIANLAVFPVAIGFFLLANYFIEAFSERGNNNIELVLTPPLLGGTNEAALSAIIGLGFLLMLPNLLNTVKAALKAPKINFGPIMGPVATGASGVGALPKKFFTAGERYRYSTGRGTGPFEQVYRFFGNPLYRKGQGVEPKTPPKT